MEVYSRGGGDAQWTPPPWLMFCDPRLHPSWLSLVETLRSKDAATLQGKVLAERMVELSADPNGPSAQGKGGGWGGHSGQSQKARRLMELNKGGTRQHIAQLEELQEDMTACWKSFELEVQRGAQATHQAVADRTQKMLSNSAEVFNRRLAQTDAQKRFFVTKLQQLKRGGAVTTTSEISTVAAAWQDQAGARCWEYGSDMPLPGQPPLPPGVPKQSMEQLRAEVVALGEQLAAAREREADLTTQLKEMEPTEAKLTKLEETKKLLEKRLRTTERERQEKNEEVSRLHLQLRGAVDGLKKKTEESKRAGKAVKEMTAKLEAAVADKATLERLVHDIQQMGLSGEGRLSSAASGPQSPGTGKGRRPSFGAGGSSDGGLLELQRLKEQRARDMVHGGEDERPGLGAIPAAPLPAVLRQSQVTAVLGTAGHYAMALQPPNIVTAAAAEADAVDAAAGTSAAATAAAEEEDATVRVCPSFHNAALLPFAVLQPGEEETLNFDMENIAAKGSRSAAFQCSTQVLVDVLRSEMSAARSFSAALGEAGTSADDLKQLLQLKANVHQHRGGRTAAPATAAPAPTPAATAAPEAAEATGAALPVAEEMAALQGLLEKLEQSVTMQRGRHNHLTESVPMFMSVLSQISKPHGLQATSCTRAAEFAAADAAAADTMLTETITAYLDWQADFLAACKPTMDITDGLLVQLYDSIRKEKLALEENHAKAEAGVKVARDLLSVSEALWRRLWDEQESRTLEHTDTMLAEGRAVLQEMETASTAAREIAALRTELDEVLAARELEIKMNAELELLKLRQPDERTLEKALRRVAKHADKVSRLQDRQQKVVARLAELGVSEDDLRAATNEPTVSNALRHRQLRVFVENRALSDYTAVTPVANCARKNILTAHFKHQACLIKSVQVSEKDRTEFQQLVVGLRRVEHPCLAHMHEVFFTDTHAYMHHNVPEGVITMEAWMEQCSRKTFEVCEVFSQLIGCLAYLHRRGVVVRTLALTTVFMVNDRSPLLVDVEGSSSQPSASATARPRGDAGASGAGSSTETAPPPPTSSFMAMSLSAMGASTVAPAATPTESKSASQFPATQPGMAWAVKVKQPSVQDPSTFEGWGSFRGVPGYQAPELERGTASSAVSDLWAVGIMMFRIVFPNASIVPDAAAEGVRIPPHDDECLRALLTALLRTEPSQRIQTADEVLAHAFFSTDMLGRDSSATGQIVQTEWKIKLLREYGRRLQMGRPPIPISISMEHLVDSTLGAFAQLFKGMLVQPLHVTFINASNALANQKMPTMASLYTSFFAQMLHSPHKLFETCRGAAYLPTAGAACSILSPTGVAVDLFELVGRILVKCLIDGYSVPPALGPSLSKYLLDVEPTLEDLDPFHPQLASVLHAIMEINFNSSSASEQAQQLRGQVELLLGADHAMQSLPLTSQAQCEAFVAAVTRQTLVTSRKAQLEAFRTGFQAVDLTCYLPVFSPRDLIQLFTSPNLD